MNPMVVKAMLRIEEEEGKEAKASQIEAELKIMLKASVVMGCFSIVLLSKMDSKTIKISTFKKKCFYNISNWGVYIAYFL